MKKQEMVEKLLSKSYKIYTWDRKDDCDCPYMEVYRDGRWQFDLILVEVDQMIGHEVVGRVLESVSVERED